MQQEESVWPFREEEEGDAGFRYALFLFKMGPSFIVQVVFSSWTVISVIGPFIVYMLRDIDILEDWTAIKKVKNES